MVKGSGRRWVVVLAGAGALALASAACAETSCEETRTCPGGSTGGAGGTGGKGGTGGGVWTGGKGGTGGAGGTDAGGGTGGVPPVGSFDISVTQTKVTVTEGESANLAVAVSRNQMTDPITVELVGLPAGLTSSAVVAGATQTSVILSVSAAAGAAHGIHSVTVRGSAGADQKDVPIELSVRGKPGTLDKSFAVAGEVTVNLYGEWSRARSLAVAPDGKIYLAGETGTTLGNIHAYFLARYESAGKIDSSFGTGGVVVRYMNGNTGEHVARGVIVDAQQRPVVAGYFTGNQIHVARFDTSGALDPTFGTAGEVTGPGGSMYALVAAATKLVAAGKDDKTPAHAVAGRLDADGKPDTAFGVQSFATLDTGTYTSEAVAAALDADNKIVLAGSTSKPGAGVMVARLTTSGGMDTFGTAGIAWLDSTVGGTTRGLVVRPDKRVVVGGEAGSDKWFLIQLDAQGAKDTSFGASGLATGTQMRIEAMTLDATGRIVAVGRSAGSPRMGRFTTNGSPDATFGANGFSDPSTQNQPHAIVVLPDGRVLVAGASTTGTFDKVYLARLWM